MLTYSAKTKHIKNIQTLQNESKKASLEKNAQKIVCVSPQQNAV